jgi:hypothetical protein
VPAGLLDEPQPVQVANRGREPLDIEVGKRDFVQHPDGSLSFEENAPYSASNWVTATPDRFRLDPGATAQVQVRFSPPAEPDAGDHQVVLVFLAPAPAWDGEHPDQPGGRAAGLPDRRRSGRRLGTPRPPQCARVLGRRSGAPHGDRPEHRHRATATSADPASSA